MHGKHDTNHIQILNESLQEQLALHYMSISPGDTSELTVLTTLEFAWNAQFTNQEKKKKKASSISLQCTLDNV